MARPASETLTPLELDIMKVLWHSGPSTVQSVQEILSADRPLAYTSVQTMLNVLEKKGKVKRSKKDRAHVYEAKVSRESAVKRSVDEVIDRLFGGSAGALMMNLLETRNLSEDKLSELEEMLRRKRAGEEPK